MKLLKSIIVSLFIAGVYSCSYVYTPSVINETEPTPFDYIKDPIVVNATVFGYPEARFGFGFKTNIDQRVEDLGLRMNVLDWEKGEFSHSSFFYDPGTDYNLNVGVYCKATNSYYASWRGKIVSLDPSTGKINVDYNAQQLGLIRLRYDTITDNGYSLLADYLAYNKDNKIYLRYYIYNFKEKKLNEVPLEMENNGRRSEIGNLVKDSQNKLWFSSCTDGIWSGYRLDPETATLEKIFDYPSDNEFATCLGEFNGKIIFSINENKFIESEEGKTATSPEITTCRLFIYNENSMQLERVVEDKRFPSYYMRHMYIYNNELYIFYRTDDIKRTNNYLFRFNPETGELTDMNKNIDFYFTGKPKVIGDNMFLFNAFAARSAFIGVRVNIPTMEIVQEYKIPNEDYSK